MGQRTRAPIRPFARSRLRRALCLGCLSRGLGRAAPPSPPQNSTLSRWPAIRSQTTEKAVQISVTGALRVYPEPRIVRMICIAELSRILRRRRLTWT